MKVNSSLICMISCLALFFESCGGSKEACQYYHAEINQISFNTLSASAGPGTPPFTYVWNTGATLREILVSTDGLYTCNVTDFSNCSDVGTFNYHHSSSGCDTAGVFDSDHNYYTVVTIGTQCWLGKNLIVSAGIPEIKDKASWDNLSTPGWCYYNYDKQNEDIYGKLYNGYAMTSGKLCPKGYHIPSDEEWTILINQLGGDTIAGFKLKNTAGAWKDPNLADGSSGFGAYPGGRTQADGEFIYLGEQAHFWSSTETAPGSNLYWYRGLVNSLKSVFRISWNPKYGFSCRCVKD